MSLTLTVKNLIGTNANILETVDGVRVSTDCLYPSFSTVNVYIVKKGNGYIVHDAGEAASCAWIHGRDYESVLKRFKKSASLYRCDFEENVFKVVAQSSEWLRSAVLSVANAAADAANAVVSKANLEKNINLEQMLEKVLKKAVFTKDYKKEYSYTGASGRSYKFDFAIEKPQSIILIGAVSPHANSINSKFAAFSDTEYSSSVHKHIVHSGDLRSSDKVLLSNVADLISIKDLSKNDAQQFLH